MSQNMILCPKWKKTRNEEIMPKQLSVKGDYPREIPIIGVQEIIRELNLPENGTGC